jgi:UDP-N-acetylglucosamine 2-epimerase (non-hydrolysing)
MTAQFLGLARDARLIVSDSGGVQEECTAPAVERPVIVVRNSTEQPEAIDVGFAHLVQPGPAITELGRRLIGDPGRAPRRHALPARDGRASERITDAVRSYLRRPDPV